MRERRKIAVASGKGGVGKSMLASSLAMLFSKSKKTVAVDADVDAPNLHLWLGQSETWDKTEEISTNERAMIDLKKCTRCGKCADICAFKAVEMINSQPRVDPFLCEGCGACEVVCPEKAIILEKVNNAEIKTKKNIQGLPLISAQLYPGQTGSGKIVDEIKRRAEEYQYQIIIIDSPAGTGCPVIAALNGINFAVLITEPTPSGFSDLKRVLTVVNHFKLPYGVVINKWGINEKISDKIKNWSQEKFLGKIDYDKRIFQAIAQLEPILTTDLPAKKQIKKIYDKLKKRI